MAFGLSFFDVPITMNHATFVGWDNFVEAFHDPRFINSLKVTAIFTGIEVPVQVLGALVIAAFISKNNKRNKFLRAVYFLPVICSATAVSYTHLDVYTKNKTKSPVVISKWDIIAKKVAIYPEEINCRDIYVKKNFICPNRREVRDI